LLSIVYVTRSFVHFIVVFCFALFLYLFCFLRIFFIVAEPLSEIMGCTSTKAVKAESDTDRYHQDLFAAAQTGDVKRLKDILDELDKRKASATKKTVLNMGM
jgi:hypothetical protein